MDQGNELLRRADERGCVTIDRLEMLGRQGAAQLEIWTGRRSDIDEIRKYLRRALEMKTGRWRRES